MSDDTPLDVYLPVASELDELMPAAVDHMFIVSHAIAQKWSPQQLMETFPNMPEYIAKGLLDRRMTVDSKGFVFDLH